MMYEKSRFRSPMVQERDGKDAIDCGNCDSIHLGKEKRTFIFNMSVMAKRY